MIQLTIEAKIVPDSDICNCRKEESLVPKIPNWCCKSLGGRTFGPHVNNNPPEIPHKKRWFAHDLYYTSYHVEYKIWEHRRQYRSAFNDCPPNSEYMDWMVNFIAPNPGELIYIKYRGCRLIPDSPQVENTDMKYYVFKVEKSDGNLKAGLISVLRKIMAYDGHRVIDENGELHSLNDTHSQETKILYSNFDEILHCDKEMRFPTGLGTAVIIDKSILNKFKIEADKVYHSNGTKKPEWSLLYNKWQDIVIDIIKNKPTLIEEYKLS